MKKWLEEIEKIDTIDEMEELIEKISYDEEITNDEYCTLYTKALDKIRKF